jgi:molybdopterin-guanine dinucleotide biosynthesis protein A
MTQFTAIILAGGRSERMGANKALTLFRGKPMIGYPLELAENFTSSIIISDKGDDLKSYGYQVVSDIFPANAPLVGIHAGLTHSPTAWNLVLTCDMPLIPVDLIRLLADRLPVAGQLLVPGHNRLVEPLCGFYHRDLLPVITKNIQNKKFSMLELIRDHPERVLWLDEWPVFSPSEIFRNVNRPEDLSM